MDFNPSRVSYLYRSFHQEESFLLTMARMRKRGTSEPKDRIFATLHHAGAWLEEEQRSIVKPDYAKDLQDLYLETAVGILKKMWNLDLLSFVTHEDMSTMLPT